MSKVAWLIDAQPDGQLGRWLLDKEEYIIGRRPPADLVLSFRRLSRRHASITPRDKGYYLTDLNSRNGTFVNGRLLGTTPHHLYSGDEINFGGEVTFRFHDPDETTEGPRLGRLTGIWIDTETNNVWVDSRLVHPPLSQPQFILLSLFYEQAGKIVSHAQIIATVWPDADPSGVSRDAVRGLIKRLRKRLRQIQPQREYIKVVRGRGLKLVHPDE